jgi:hypothetical protein
MRSCSCSRHIQLLLKDGVLSLGGVTTDAGIKERNN